MWIGAERSETQSLYLLSGVACAVRTIFLSLYLPKSALFRLIVHIRSTRPIHRVNATLDESVKTGIRPIASLLHITMFDRVPMNIIYVFFKITVISNLMFPKPPLPQSQLTSFLSRGRQWYCNDVTCIQTDFTFNHVPTHSVTSVMLWQCPDAMQMIRQQHKRLDCEWVEFLYRPYALFQSCIDLSLREYSLSLVRI